jgi:hypothetical protein
MDQMDLALRTPQKSMALPPPPAHRAASAPMLLVAAATVAAAIFVADTVTQLEIAVVVLYVAVILIVVRIFERRGVLIVALACVGLTILSYFLSPDDLSRSTGFINCAISIAAILVSTYLAVCTENPIGVDDERNHLSWRNDRATTFRSGYFGLAIQVEDPASG